MVNTVSLICPIVTCCLLPCRLRSMVAGYQKRFVWAHCSTVIHPWTQVGMGMGLLLVRNELFSSFHFQRFPTLKVDIEAELKRYKVNSRPYLTLTLEVRLLVLNVLYSRSLLSVFSRWCVTPWCMWTQPLGTRRRLSWREQMQLCWTLTLVKHFCTLLYVYYVLPFTCP